MARARCVAALGLLVVPFGCSRPVVTEDKVKADLVGQELQLRVAELPAPALFRVKMVKGLTVTKRMTAKKEGADSVFATTQLEGGEDDVLTGDLRIRYKLFDQGWQLESVEPLGTWNSLRVNEAMTIRDIRTMISAQAAYQSANRANYASSIRCLVKPSGCLEGYTNPDLPTFLSPEMEQPTRHGYTFEYDGGVAAFALVGRPVQPGISGARTFCGDATGIIRGQRSDIRLRPGQDGSSCDPAAPPL
jgi:hypothetical protein